MITPSTGRHLAASAYAACLLVMLGVVQALAADERLLAVRDRFDAIRTIFDQTEAALIRPSARDEDLAALRGKADPLRGEVRDKIGEIEPERTAAETRLKELGPPPAAAAPPEDPKIAAQRSELTTLLGDFDGVLRQGRLLALRGDQIIERIDSARRALFTQRLLARSESVLSPSLWLDAAKGFPTELTGLAQLVLEWKDAAAKQAGFVGIAGALIAIIALIAAILMLRRTILRRLDRVRADAAPSERHPRAATIALSRAALGAATPPLATYAAIEVLRAFDMLPPRVDEIANGLLAGMILLSVGTAIAHAVLAPGAPGRRLMLLNDEVAERLYRSVASAIFVVALAVFLHVVHRVLGAYVSMRLATSALMALIVAVFVARLLLADRPSADDDPQDGLPYWVRLLGWVAVAAIFATLATGHISLAAFVATRIVDAVIVLGGLVLLLALIDSLFDQGVAAEHPRRRHLAATFGIKPSQVDFFGTLIAGLLRALLFVVAAFLLVGGFGASVTDIASTLDRFTFGIEVGQIRVALLDVLAAAALLVAGIVVTRIVHRWLANTVLPRASLEIGLQNSIATMFAYLGVIAATLIALGQLGINLQNVALVAGALSVGIGFGLQSVVSNFVSGIILLAERPIRVGDIIEVKGEEGYVRRINVRATEIETFARANVIIPNSELVTNVVKNWTKPNTSGRTIVKVGVAFNSDPDKVREILLTAADQHAQVMKSPAPRVLLLGFGERALEFELRCIVTDIDFAASIRSDLYFAVLQRFRAEGIEIPFQPFQLP